MVKNNMETIVIEVDKLKPNPFKKNINKGKLSDNTISKLIESINHGTLPEIFTVRKSGDNYELCYGHHRKYAISKKKGKNHKVLCNIVERTDKEMIIDMARENLAQRSNDFKEERATILFVQKYIKDDLERNAPLQPKGHGGDRRSNEIGSRQIAEFLSKDGKVVSHNKVSRILKIENSISPDIIEKIERSSNQWDKPEDVVSVSIAEEISQIKDHKDQKLILKEAKEKEMGHKKLRKIVSAFKNSPEEVKEQIRNGSVSLSDISLAIIQYNLRENKKNKLEIVDVKNKIESLIYALKFSISDSEKELEGVLKDIVIFSRYIKHMTENQKARVSGELYKFSKLLNKLGVLIGDVNKRIENE